MRDVIEIGLVSDTHGLVRPDIADALHGVSMILHAGDVCGDEVLEELDLIAPVHAVMGNCDPPGHPRLPVSFTCVVGGIRIHVSHGHQLGLPMPTRLLAATDADVVVYGHTHRPLVHREQGRLVINPGAAGPRRFDIAPSIARLTIERGTVTERFVDLVG